MATMQDVARRAQVSLSTVSYALSGTRPVSDATRRRIEDAMAELGYQPNAMARGLASRRSHVLALIYPAMEKGLGGTVAEFVSSAAETARENGYHLVLWPFRTTQRPRSATSCARGWRTASCSWRSRSTTRGSTCCTRPASRTR